MEHRSVFINLSNHPSHLWSDAQREAATRLGEIVDMKFPTIDASASDDEVAQLVKESVDAVMELAATAQVTVHVMGEMVFTHRVVCELKSHGLRCVASTTERVVTTNDDGTKTSAFRFDRFRDY